MKKAILIYNPLSGGQRISQEIDHIIDRMQNQGVFVQPYRISGNEQKSLVEIIREYGFDFGMISGGDGTLNIIVNIFLRNQICLPIGIIPTGTCNDFACSLNIQGSVDDCLDIILQGKTFDVDVGLLNDEYYFLSTCAGGSFVDVSFSTQSELKKNFGPFAYYLKGLTEVRNIKSFKLKLTTDTETVEGRYILFLILNGKSAAGFSNIIKEADISDGLMDIVLIKNCSHIDLASIFFKVLSSDSLNNKNVTILRARTCMIEGSNDLSLTVDGEKGPSLPLNVKFVHEALKVFVK